MALLSKRNKTYRQDSYIASLVETAADAIGVSEAEIVDACIRENVETVVTRIVRSKHALKHPAVLTALLAKLRRIVR